MNASLILVLVPGLFLVVSAELCTNDTCEYKFVIQRKSSHLYRDGNSHYEVGLSGSTLVTQANSWRDTLISKPVPSDDVITLDGHRRDVIVINDQFPGPTIDVLAGAKVVVYLLNSLLHDVVTIHWHGIHQRGTFWMDGVPHVTQCPIRPGHTFTYRFIADPVGTHWYHTHIKNQRADGLFGMLLIHPSLPSNPYSAMSVVDWMHSSGESANMDFPFSGGAGSYYQAFQNQRFGFSNIRDSFFTFHSILINGRGRQMNSTDEWPLETFVVGADPSTTTHRFHVAHTGMESAIRISVDQHDLTIVATDDGDIEPITVESCWIFVSETIDFTIESTKPGKYWIRLETIGSKPGLGQAPDGMTPMGRAVMRYDGTPVGGYPTTTPNSCTPSQPCRVFNCPFEKYPSGMNRVCVHMDAARTTVSQAVMNQKYGLDREPDMELFFNFNGVSINGHTYVPPRVPLFKKVPDQITPCDPEECLTGCRCTHIVRLPYKKVVQIVVSNYARTFSRPHDAHPLHMHGNSFAVLKMGFGPMDATTGLLTGNNPDINCTAEDCLRTQWAGQPPTLNFYKPPVKNVLILPPQGYVTLRIFTDNPGYWLTHCHFLRHTSLMALLFQVGNLPKVPKNFPECDITNFDGQQMPRTSKSG